MNTTRRTVPTSPDADPSEVAASAFPPVADSSDESVVGAAQPESGPGEGESGCSEPIHPFSGHRADGADYYSSGVYVNTKPTSSRPGLSKSDHIALLMAGPDASPHIDRSEHVEALGEWCDCNACLRSRDLTRARICAEQPKTEGHQLSRADVALLLSAGLKGEIPLTTPVPEALSIARARVRDPATVVDIAQARRRAMPLSEREQFDQDVMLTGAGFLRQWVDELGVPHEQRIPPEQVFLGRLPKPTFRARVDAWVIANRGWLLFWGLCAGFALAVWLGVR